MILLQSYTSQTPLSRDKGMMNAISKEIPDLRVLFKKKTKVHALRVKEMFPLIFKALFKTKRNDIIFGWGGDIGVYAWLFGRLLGLNRDFYSQNLIIRDKSGGLKSKFRYNLYRKALQSDNFRMSVNAPELVKFYSDFFKCSPSKFDVVLDSMEVDGNIKIENDVDKPYVFCGGKAARDVESFIEIVRRMPDVNFKCVFPPSIVTTEMKALPNLKIKTDLPKEEFDTILANAEICCIPLKSKAPCGLLVMQTAALYKIPIVSTETFSMRTVVPDDSCGFLLPMHDVENMVVKLRIILEDNELKKRISDNCYNNAAKFSPAYVGKDLCSKILKGFKV